MPNETFYTKLYPSIKPVIKAIILVFSFFIIIGETTRWIIKEIVIFPGRVILLMFTLLEKGFKKIPRLTFHFPEVRIPRIRFPRVKFKKLNLAIPTRPKAIKIKKVKAKRKSETTVKILYFLFGLCFTVIVVSIYVGYLFFQSLPNPKLIGTLNYPVSTQIFDRKGKLIYEIFHDQNRTPVQYKKIPLYITQASIAIEDKDFYRHNGISIYGGIFRAMKDMVLTHTLQGGSTITQQLVKSALLSPERTVPRKIKEIILAIWTEQVYTKDQILEMYLNQVPYGGSAYGIEEAAEQYFNKKAQQLTLSEAATLAGLPQAPTYYSPYINPQLTLRRRNEVLKNMYQQHYISKTQYEESVRSKLNVQPFSQDIKAPHFVFYIKSLLEQQYGIQQVGQGGLRVMTSLDLDVQKNLEQILREELDKVGYLNISNGAILVTEPSTGEVLAMVGSKDYYAADYGTFNVTTALRQPGSSIKPLMYGLALERGYTAATTIDDSPISFYIPGAQPYSPVNYDSRYHGRVTLRSALANSYNVPAVKVLNTIGVQPFIDRAEEMGITTWKNREMYGLSITLGGAEVKMTDMAVAYGVFANNGKRMDLHPIESITDFKGNQLYDRNTDSESKQVISPNTAFIISDILSDNIARRPAFGANSQLEIKNHKVAVKTGTTNDKKDNWTIGYTPQILVTVWVGNNNNSPMNPVLTSGITGAAPIWNRTMTYLLDSYHLESDASESFIVPDNMVRKLCGNKIEYFEQGTDNKINCQPVPSIALPLPSISPFMR